MEGSGSWCGVGIVVIVVAIVLWYGWRFVNWVWLTPKKMEKSLREQGLKGNSYKFLFGDMKEMVKMIKETQARPINLTHDVVPRILPFVHKSVSIYGNNCFTWLGPTPFVHITEPAMIKEILLKRCQFQKQPIEHPLKLLAQGLVAAEADQWLKHRKIINPAFHVEKLKHMVPSFYTSCCEMINTWEEMIKKDGSCEVDVWPSFEKLTGDVISRTAFGSSFEEGKRIFELQREQAELVVEALNSVNIPGLRFLPTKRNKRIKEIDREVKATIKSIIDKRMIAKRAGETSNDDLLGILLDSNYNEIEQHGSSNFGLTIEEIIEECKLFYLAGQRTTGNLLVWTMILLGQHTNWQARARDEVLLMFGKEKPNIDGLNRLKIVTMIINEVLRLYPPVAIPGRMVHEETKLQNLVLPVGCFLQLEMMFLHHDKDIWGDDVNEFKPERFSEGVSKVTNGQTSYFPFGGGPRICIGQNFALLEAKMALALILQHFSFDLSPSYSHAPQVIITLQPQFGAHLILHKL